MQNKHKWKIAIGLLGIGVSLTAHAAVNITQIHVINIDKATRLIINANNNISPRVFTLENPDRLVVDMEDARFAAPQEDIPAGAIVQTMRKGFPTDHTLRLVFDLKKPAQFKQLSVAGDQRIVLDVFAKSTQANQVNVVTANSERISKQLPRQNISLDVVKPLKPVAVNIPDKHEIVVVIDAGHGGKDPGAVGRMGTREKDVVLGISRQLADIINQQPNMRAVMTRKGDYFVPLRDRLRLARKGKADLFVAVHADSYFNQGAQGASVYVLSPHGATSEAARWLAKRDNYSELGGVDLSELGDQSYLLRSVLIDLAQTATITDSLRLGKLLLNELDEVGRLHHSRVEQAPFMVLKSPDIPSVLVETGFISTPSEEAKLRDPSYQRQLARALFSGIEDYSRKYGLLGV